MFIIRFIATLAFAFFSFDAYGGVINNGDFSSAVDLEGFVPTGNVTEPSPGGFALFGDDGVLSQTFVIPDAASVLSFDFAFSTEATPASAGFFPDAFSAELTTSPGRDVLDIFVADVLAVQNDPSNRFQASYGTVPINVSYDPLITIAGFGGFAGGTEYSGRISLSLPGEVLGETATISFGLVDFDFDASIAALDNLSVTSTSSVIPEPSSRWIWVGTLALVTYRYRTRCPRVI